MNYPHKFLQAYGITCRSLCQEIKMPQTAFDILMFLANNPDFYTARDIVEIRGIKANLVSINVEKLVQEKLLKEGRFRVTEERPCWSVPRKHSRSLKQDENYRKISMMGFLKI